MDAGASHAVCAGASEPNHPCPDDPYPPLNPAEACRSSQRLVDEVTVHCDILEMLMQTSSGETMAHEARVRSHLARMQHSHSYTHRPDGRVRRRVESGPLT